MSFPTVADNLMSNAGIDISLTKLELVFLFAYQLIVVLMLAVCKEKKV